MTTITAIIPCFNGGRWLDEAIASIQAQTRPVDEIVVVDDCSTDDSVQIALARGVTVLENPVNSGGGVTRNRGISHAAGDLVALLDADDMWLPHHVEMLAGLLEANPAAVAAFGAVQRFGRRDELILGAVPPGPPSDVFWAAFRTWVHIPTGAMIRKSALVDIGGFDENERFSVDFDLWLRLSYGRLFIATHEITSLWRWHDVNLSTRHDHQLEAVHRFRRAFVDAQRASASPRFLAALERQADLAWGGDLRHAVRARDWRETRMLLRLARALTPARRFALLRSIASRLVRDAPPGIPG